MIRPKIDFSLLFKLVRANLCKVLALNHREKRGESNYELNKFAGDTKKQQQNSAKFESFCMVSTETYKGLEIKVKRFSFPLDMNSKWVAFHIHHGLKWMKIVYSFDKWK